MPRNSRDQGVIKTNLPGGTLSQFAQGLRLSGRLVIDRTGIADTYDIHIEYAVDDAAPSDVPSMETALARLGLRLERITAPRECVIVDHAERPSGNYSWLLYCCCLRRRYPASKSHPLNR